MIKNITVESLVRLFRQLQQDSRQIRSYLHPPMKKTKSFCDYRGCLNKVRMKKRGESGPSKKYVEKMLGYLKERMGHLKQVPDLDGKKEILQVSMFL